MVQRFCRVAALLFTLSFLAVPLVSTSAQAATITVNPVWHPPVQLTSIASEPTPRKAQADIWVTSNVQFWLAQFTCTVTATVLPTNPTVVWSTGVWGTDINAFTHKEQFPAAGKSVITATELDPSPPVGQNGVMQTQLLVTLTYDTPTTVPANASSPFTCTAIFLDRNGKSVATAMVKAPAPLQVVTGYSLKGTVTYPGRASAATITVNCTNPGPPSTSGTATAGATGSFTINNLRALGTYQCIYSGGINFVLQTPPAPPLSLHLAAFTNVNVSSQGVTLAPVILDGGDTNHDGAINDPDLNAVTGNLGNTGMTPATGDLTGDGKVDGVDLAILASSYNKGAFIDARHLLVGISRSPSLLYNDRVWLGNAESNTVMAYGGSATAKAYWPVLSPDGTKIAYIQEVAAGTFDPITGFVTKLPRYALFVGAAAGTTGTQITPANWNYDAFAPVWSPDGTKVAFACATSDGNPLTAQWTNGLTGGNVSLCVIDPSGTNLSVHPSAIVSIQRPAWVSNSQIVVADPSGVLAQYDLGLGSAAALQNTSGSGSSATYPVFKDGMLYFIYSDSSTPSQLRVIDYADIGLSPIAVPGFTERSATPTVPGYQTDVVDSTTQVPIDNFSIICGYDVAPADMEIVTDFCNGSYFFFKQTVSDLSANAPMWSQRSDRVTIDGAVAAPSAGGPNAIWIRAVANSVNFVP